MSTKRGRGKNSSKAGSQEAAENQVSGQMVASEVVAPEVAEGAVKEAKGVSGEDNRSPEEIVEAVLAAGAAKLAAGLPEVSEAERSLRCLREVWPHLGAGAASEDLYVRFQEFKERLGRTLWKQFGHTPLGITDHDLLVEVMRTVEREQEEQREAARKNLEKAQMAARCSHVHLDGARCGCPKMKDRELCYIHDKLEKAKSEKLDLGPMDDPDSIQVGIAKLQTAVIDGMLAPMQVRQLAYLIQLAAWNVKQTTLMAQRWNVGEGLKLAGSE